MTCLTRLVDLAHVAPTVRPEGARNMFLLCRQLCYFLNSKVWGSLLRKKVAVLAAAGRAPLFGSLHNSLIGSGSDEWAVAASLLGSFRGSPHQCHGKLACDTRQTRSTYPTTPYYGQHRQRGLGSPTGDVPMCSNSAASPGVRGCGSGACTRRPTEAWFLGRELVPALESCW